jgi:hypothetical protein
VKILREYYTNGAEIIAMPQTTHGPLLLWDFLGDPDAWRCLEYEKMGR